MVSKYLNYLIMFFVVVFLFISFQVNAQELDDIRYMTEQFPPYNFEEDGELKGITVDILREIFEKENINAEIELLPWAQGYSRLKEKENTALFGTTRTKEREDMFRWVGQVANQTIGIIAKKDSDISLKSLENIKNYDIGTVREDAAEQLLLDEGISERELDRSSDIKSNIRKLDAGRIDLVSYTYEVFLQEANKLGYNPGNFELVYIMDEYELYYAFNKNTSDETIKKMQSILDELKVKGIVEDITNDYIK